MPGVAEALRNWEFLGQRKDDTEWIVLRKHVDDDALKTKGQAYTWELPDVNPSDYFTKFQIKITGKNSNNAYYLACSGFELYGTLLGASGAPIGAQPKGKVGICVSVGPTHSKVRAISISARFIHRILGCG